MNIQRVNATASIENPYPRLSEAEASERWRTANCNWDNVCGKTLFSANEGPIGCLEEDHDSRLLDQSLHSTQHCSVDTDSSHLSSPSLSHSLESLSH